MSRKDPNDGGSPESLEIRALCHDCNHPDLQRNMMQTERGLVCMFCASDSQKELEYNVLDQKWLDEEAILLMELEDESDSGRMAEDAEEGD